MQKSQLSGSFSVDHIEHVNGVNSVIVRAHTNQQPLFPWYVALRSATRKALGIDIQEHLFFEASKIGAWSPLKTQLFLTDGVCELLLKWSTEKNDVVIDVTPDCEVVTQAIPVSAPLLAGSSKHLSTSVDTGHIKNTETLSDSIVRYAKTLFDSKAAVRVFGSYPMEASVEVEGIRNTVVRNGNYWERLQGFVVLTGSEQEHLTCFFDGYYNRGLKQPTRNDYLPMETSELQYAMTDFSNDFCKGLAQYISSAGRHP